MTFFLKTWHFWVIGALALALAGAWELAQWRGADLKQRTAERDAAVKSANDWKSAYDDAQKLAQATAQAHAAEARSLSKIQSAAGAAKQGASHAPGADDRFVYSDSAYGFMRGPPAQPAGVTPQAAAGVDHR